MKKLNQKLLKDFHDRKIAIQYRTKDHEKIKEFFKEQFPEDNSESTGAYLYSIQHKLHINELHGSNFVPEKMTSILIDDLYEQDDSDSLSERLDILNNKFSLLHKKINSNADDSDKIDELCKQFDLLNKKVRALSAVVLIDKFNAFEQPK